MLSLSRPARQRPTKQLSRPELVVLWIHRAHHLAQDLHHTTCIAVEEETPEETVGLIRDAVSVLLKNMVALGKASLKYGSFGDANTAGYFVPPGGTTLFGMAERFVDLYGYHGDTSPFDRALMFDNLNTLFCTMVLDEEYLRFGIDFPNFDVSKADLERYGIYEFIKPRQIARLSSEDPGTVAHQFGDRLLRYNPKLGDEARYQFPDPSREYAATRPNTPVLSQVAGIADELMEEEEDSDKENENISGSGYLPSLVLGAQVEARRWVRQMQIRQLLIRSPGLHVSSISQFLPLLNALSLEDKTLELVRWRLSEGWAAFLEFRLHPMVYFVHAAVTHDFTLVGAKGVYSLVELDHIKYWVGCVLLHCVEITALISLRCTFGVHGRRLHLLPADYRSAGGGDSNVQNNAQSLPLSRLPIQPGIVGSEPRPPDSSALDQAYLSEKGKGRSQD
ncbi:hypothetical protein B0H14DRAFT_2579497 [Mycena olivaceomarginata]|nr:hypothetical protein B0H14DRAFT_2579497 [Mycena olivaceomarginata]